MSASVSWKASAESRSRILTEHGVFWRHDGNKKRPYVRLSSGKISNGYFNGGIIAERPYLLDRCARALAWEYLVRSGTPIDRVLSPAMGGITLGHSLALHIYELSKRKGSEKPTDLCASYAEKTEEGFAFLRNLPREGERFLLTEDTLTTGGSVLKVHDAASSLFGSFEPYIVCLCNRTGETTLNGFELISYVEASFDTWEEGENPFTGGPELIAPIEKAKENWSLLTREYA